MQAEVAPPQRDERRLLVRRIQDRLAGPARFHETMSYSFLSDTILERVGAAELPHVRVINPVDQAESRIRRDVLPSLFAGLENNRRNLAEVRLFEIGKGYHPEAANEKGEPKEVHRLALLWATAPAGKQARFDENQFSALYGVIEDLLHHLGLESPSWTPAEVAPGWAHPSRILAARWEGLEGDAAQLANLEPGLARALGLEGELSSDVACAEISIDHLLRAPRRGSDYRPIPRFPGIKVDVAFDSPRTSQAADFVQAIEKAGKGQVVSSELFDVYQGKSIAADRKSLAYHVLLQSETKTLTDKDQAKFLKRLEKQLENLSARLRK
jgi:phenylalanyl-tRNA synthetase beta chain